MTALGFADFISLGKLLTLILASTQSGAEVTVLLPTRDVLPGEEVHLRSAQLSQASGHAASIAAASRRRRQRVQCNLFLQQSGFEDAIRDGPWPAGQVTLIHPDRSGIALTTVETLPQVQPTEETPRAPDRLRQVLPFQWIRALASDDAQYIRSISILKASLQAMGLSEIDASALTHCVLQELLENVDQHAHAPGADSAVALVGGTIIQADKYNPRADDYDADLSLFLRWGAKNSSPLLRLFVGDAGRGIPAELPPRRIAAPDASWAGGQTRRSEGQEAILHALDRWSASTDLGPRSGAYGLWKVERLIRSYCGAILISSGHDIAGKVFAGAGDPLIVGHEQAAWVPGTSIECDVLLSVATVSGLSQAIRSIATHPDSAPHLECAVAAITSSEGFASSDLRRLQLALRELPSPESAGLVIFADARATPGPLVDTDLLDALSHIFGMASEEANPATIALIFSGVNPRFLSLAVEEFNERHDVSGFTDVLEVSNPILIISPHSQHYWIGGTPEIRELLTRLSSAVGPVNLADVIPARDTQEIHPWLREIRDQTALLRTDDTSIYLTLRPRDVLAALTAYLKAKLRESYASAPGPGVEKGLFLTPSLRVTTLWSDPNEVLRHHGSERLAGFVLASLLEQRLGDASRTTPSPPVVRAGTPSHDLLESLSLSLGGAGEYFESIDYLQAALVGSDSQKRPQVIICTDLISSGFTLGHVLDELRSDGVSVIGIASVVDARELRDIEGDAGIFHFRDFRIPLVSLADVAIGNVPLDTIAGSVTPIDTVLGRPIYGPTRNPRQLKDQDSYIDALTKTRAARLGHIRRPIDRHYSAYVDPTLLFADEKWSYEVTWAAKNKIVRRHRSIFGRSSAEAPIVIIYPTGTSDRIAEVARSFASALHEERVKVADVFSVHRTAVGSRWIFPVAIHLPKSGAHVLIVDSGMSSGHTVQQLTRLAASAGAGAVTAVVLLDALSAPDALALQQISAVACDGSPLDMYPGGGQVSFALYFVSGTAVNSNSTRKCSICSLRERYVRANHPMPTRLLDHLEWLVKTLQVRPKEHVFEAQATDLLGTPVLQSDCVEYLRWKARLRSAGSNTVARQEVVTEVGRLVDEPQRTSARDALVRLLVAESHWLNAAPLWFPQVQAEIAALTLRLLREPLAMSIDPMLRVQAVILLSLTSPESLAANITSLVFDSTDNEYVLCQVLLEAQLALDTSLYPADSASRARLLAGLVDVEDTFAQSVGSWPSPIASPLEEIRSLVALGRRATRPLPATPQEAWAELRSYRSSIREHTYDAAMWRIQLRVENLMQGYSPKEPESVRLDWGPCRDFLCLEVLPNLEQLRPILLARPVLRRLANDDLLTWTRVINGDGPAILDAITNKLETAFAAQQPSGFIHSGLHELLEALRWWNKYFLAANITDELKPRSAFMAELAQHCPAPLLPAITEVFEGSDVDVQPGDLTDDEALRVFCDSQLLRDVLSHIRINAEQRHRVPGAAQQFAIALQRGEDSTVIVEILNNGSASGSKGALRGLAHLGVLLRSYGGSIEPLRAFDPHWTYGISLCLERWKEV